MLKQLKTSLFEKYEGMLVNNMGMLVKNVGMLGNKQEIEYDSQWMCHSSYLQALPDLHLHLLHLVILLSSKAG